MKLSWSGARSNLPGSLAHGDKLARFLLPSFEDVLFLALFAAVISLGPRLLNMDGDLGRHLTIGGYMLDSRRIPTEDLFSHTRYAESLTPHEWLAQVVYALAYRLAGLDGVVILCALLIAGTFTLVYRQCLKYSGQVLTSLGFTLLAAMAASLHWLARPHLFTMMLVVIWVGVLENLRTGRTRRWWMLPVLMFVWANLHGAFLAGFTVWGIYFAGELLESGIISSQTESRGRIRYLLAGGSVALAASLINPAGWRLWETSLGFLRNSYLVGHTAEYLAPNFHLRSTWPFLGMVILSLILFGVCRRRLAAAHLLLAACWTAMALVSTRNIPLYAVLAAPILAGTCSLAFGQERRTSGFIRFQEHLAQVGEGVRGHLWPLVGIASLSIALLHGKPLDFSNQGNRFDPQVFPVQAVDWLESKPDMGPGFNYFPWGGYLLFRLWPGQRVFIDGQTDFYGEDLTRQYEQVITLQPGWEAVLERFGVSWAILPAGSPLAQALENDPGWQIVYDDGTASILSSDY